MGETMTYFTRLLAALLPDADLTEVRIPNPQRQRQELGPNQLAWLNRTIPAFRGAKRDADRARVHAEKIAGRVKG